MKKKGDTTHSGTDQNFSQDKVLFLILNILIYLFLFLIPISPDEKLTRPKLLTIEIGLLLITSFWFIRSVIQSKIRVRDTLLNLPILVYAAYIIILYFVSGDRPTAASELTRTILCLVTYFVFVNSFNDDASSRKLAVWFWIISGFLVALYGLGQHYGGIPIAPKIKLEIPQMDRIMSTFGNPIFFAVFLVATIPMVLYAALTERKTWLKWLLWLIWLVLLVALFYTKTRAAWIACAVSILLFSFLNLKSTKLKLGFVIAFGIGSIIFVTTTSQVWSRFQEHPLIWRDTLNMWLHHPVKGVGLGTFHLYFPKYASDELRKIFPQNQFIVNDTHNEYLQILAESGIIGFGIFVWLLITFYRTGMVLLKPPDLKKDNRIFYSALLASGTGILVQNFFSVDMRFIISSVYLFIVMGWLSSFEKQNVEIKLAVFGKILTVCILTLSVWFFGTEIAKPYIAQKKLAETPDFFEQKLADPKNTINDLAALARQRPDDSRVYEKLGWCYAKERDFGRAIENFEKAAQINPTGYGPFNNIGNIYFTTGNRQKAIEYYHKSLKVNPNQIDSRINLAQAYYFDGKLKEAADQLKAVLKIDPNNEKAIVMYKKMIE